MTIHPLRAAMSALGVSALLLAGCGSSEDTADTADTSTSSAPLETTTTTPAATSTTVAPVVETTTCPPPPTSMMPEGTTDVAAADAPTIELEVTPDAKAGHNVEVVTSGFTWAPEHASGAHVDGEGHAHVYVDGEKLMRLYEPTFHLKLEPGTHEVRVSLNGNDHAAYTVEGEAIDATATVVVPDMGAATTMDEGTVDVPDDAPMSVQLVAVADAKAGCNLTVETTGFTWAPEHASGEHVDGEGHAHIYVDGEKLGRLYGPALHLLLEPGTHEVRVTLNGNDHAAYVDGDAPVASTVTVEVTE